jgi:hypothetical protein
MEEVVLFSTLEPAVILLEQVKKTHPKETMVMVRITPSRPGTMLTADRLAGLK